MTEAKFPLSDRGAGAKKTVPGLTEAEHFRAEVRRATKARKSDGVMVVTCPASRHAQMIAENVGARKPYPMLQEEPEHCASSILSAVGSLYAARLELERAAKRELKLWNALQVIAAYMTPEQLRRRCEKEYGLEFEEACEYAYDNVVTTAKAALKGHKRPVLHDEQVARDVAKLMMNGAESTTSPNKNDSAPGEKTVP